MAPQNVIQEGEKAASKEAASDKLDSSKPKDISFSFRASRWTVLDMKPEEWSKDNGILEKLLDGRLYNREYVEELEKLLEFMIKEKAFTSENLNAICAKRREGFGRNLESMLVKLAPYFTPELLDHLMKCLQNDWKSNENRPSLLRFVERFAVSAPSVADNVLNFLWECAHSSSLKLISEICSIQGRILKLNHSENGDTQKSFWLEKCVEGLKTNHVLPSMEMIEIICCLYDQTATSYGTKKAEPKVLRHEVVQRLQKDHDLIDLICKNFKQFMDETKDHPRFNNELFCKIHRQAFERRLKFLTFLLKDGRHWLSYEHATIIWDCLIVSAVFREEKKMAFNWFGELIGKEPDFHPSNVKEFFENNILQLDPALLDEQGMKCFQKYFKAVREQTKSFNKSQLSTILDHPDLPEANYLSKVVKHYGEVATESMKLLLQEQANLGVDFKQLDRLLECPVCLYRLEIPVHSCNRGHFVCNNCRTGAKCPICREYFLPNRSTLFNQLLELFPTSCMNSDKGCKKMIPIPELIYHEEDCDYRFVKCFCCNEKNLIFKKLSDHVKNHSQNLVQMNLLSWQTFNVTMLPIEDKQYNVCYVEEIRTYFIFAYIFGKKDTLAHFCVLYIGKCENASRYMYEVRIDQGKGNFESNDCYYIFSGNCLPYVENCRDIRDHPKVQSVDIKRIFLKGRDFSKFKVEMRIKRRALTKEEILKM